MDQVENPLSEPSAALPTTAAPAPQPEPVPVEPARPSALGAVAMAVIGYPFANVLGMLPWLAFVWLAGLLLPSMRVQGGLRASLLTPLGLISLLPATAIGIVVVVLPATGSGWRRRREELGLVAPGLDGGQLGLALLGTSGAACLGAGAAMLAVRAHWLPPTPTSSFVAALMNVVAHAPLPLALATVLSMGVFPALGEELMFRGFILRRLLRCWPAWLAIAVGGLLFSMCHIYPSRIVATLPFALWAGYVAWRARSILPTMACHAFNNSGAALLGLAGVRFGHTTVRPAATSSLWAIFALGALLLTLAGLEFERRWRAVETRR